MADGTAQTRATRSTVGGSERAFTEGNRVLPAPRFPSDLATLAGTIEAGEEDRSKRSPRLSVLTWPRPRPEVTHCPFRVHWLGISALCCCYAARARQKLPSPRQIRTQPESRNKINDVFGDTRCSRVALRSHP